MHLRWSPVVVAAVGLAAVAVASAAVTPPPNVAKVGKLVFCSDIEYPPMESLQGSRPVGADIDIAAAIAKQMGVKAEFRNVGFDGIIAALLARKCDAIISAMTDTRERRRQVDFADYIKVGMSLMVAKDNRHHVTGLASLSGLTVATQVGTVEKDALVEENKLLARRHRKPVTIKLFNKDTDAAAALLTGKVDAYFEDDPPVGYYVKRSRGKFEVAASGIQSAPEGVATRKGEPLGPAVRRALAALYEDGSMRSILSRWGLAALAFER
jgi:polar amino acid transport system substrate-binding protein